MIIREIKYNNNIRNQTWHIWDDKTESFRFSKRKRHSMECPKSTKNNSSQIVIGIIIH